MTTIVGVRIDGQAVAFDHVSSTIGIRHGRSSVDDGPLASSASLELVAVSRPGMASFRVGVRLELDSPDGAAFRGRLSDASLDAAADTLTLTAIGELASVARRPCGRYGFPAQLWADRVVQAFTEAGAIDVLELELGAWNPPLAAVDPDASSTLGGVLGELVNDTGAAIADTPDGRVLVQTIDSRAGQVAMELPPETVLYAPEWTMVDDVANELELEWALGTFTTRDVTSVRAFEPRAASLSTRLADYGDAQRRALEFLTRRAYPDWVVSSATILARAPVTIGEPVSLTMLPPSSPAPSYLGVIEGWADSIADDEWTTTLALSAPRLSGFGVKWREPVIPWSDAGAATWHDPSSIGPTRASYPEPARLPLEYRHERLSDDA